MKKMCAYTLLRSASNYEMVSYIFPAVGSQTEEHRWYVPSRADALSGAWPFTLTDSESAYRSEYDGMKRPPILDRLGTLFLHTTGLVYYFTRLTRTLSLALLARPPTRWRHTHTHTHTLPVICARYFPVLMRYFLVRTRYFLMRTRYFLVWDAPTLLSCSCDMPTPFGKECKSQHLSV